MSAVSNSTTKKVVSVTEQDGVTVQSGVATEAGSDGIEPNVLVVTKVSVTPPSGTDATGLIRTAWPLVAVAGALYMLGHISPEWLFGYWTGSDQTGLRLFANVGMMLGFAVLLGAAVIETVKRGGLVYATRNVTGPASVHALSAPSRNPALAGPKRTLRHTPVQQLSAGSREMAKVA
ncbi:hypothetical protein BB934_45705 (plasmid) [Microvirga ossetica]|uniref:Uncharacterized protein n=1 Tax=Microvirga ossetica TaxID=1882682 RepID=A0A1B2F041_9HYPH|nr:hypothetical protein [Microvirga ossetica]ANY85517.1 hypothetical protein BB934_45705 [Microvirga ossetica]